MQVRESSTVVPVRRRRSIFSIIGMIVVLGVLLVLVYFAYVGWSSKGKPTPDVDVKTSGLILPAWPTAAQVGSGTST